VVVPGTPVAPIGGAVVPDGGLRVVAVAVTRGVDVTIGGAGGGGGAG